MSYQAFFIFKACDINVSLTWEPLTCLIVSDLCIVMDICMYINIMYRCMYDLYYINSYCILCGEGLWESNYKRNSKDWISFYTLKSLYSLNIFLILMYLPRINIFTVITEMKWTLTKMFNMVQYGILSTKDMIIEIKIMNIEIKIMNMSIT